jgi:MFS superfamily sulfate permease-like transporter
VAVIVIEDLLAGVITGIVLSAVKLLITFSHMEIHLSTSGGKPGHERVTLKISGAATFLRLPLLAARLEEVPPGAQLHVDFERLEYIDHACLELLTTWAKQHEIAGGRLTIDWGELHARFRDGSGGNRAWSATVQEKQPA